MTKSYLSQLGALIRQEDIVQKDGLSYLEVATALGLAGLPQFQFVDFGSQLHLDCMGGSLVAVDMVLPGSDLVQRIWLPVMSDDKFGSRAAADTTLYDVHNTRQRCLVKALAAVCGTGMSMYMSLNGDGPAAARLLGIAEDSDLASVSPLIQRLEDGTPYVEWAAALAAARITDAEFTWEVLMWDGKPYRACLDGLVVDVRTTYKGRSMVLTLPVMDAGLRPKPAAQCNTFDWNKTVMRGLTKCIAYNTGYGLSVYANELGGATNTTPTESTGQRRRKSEPKATPAATDGKSTENPPAAKATEPQAEKPAATPETTAAQEQAPATKAEANTPAATPTGDASASKQDAPDNAFADAIARIRTVIQTRNEKKGIPGVISVFGALATSERFTAEEKPACFAVLLKAAAAMVDSANILALLGEVKTYNAMQYLTGNSRNLVAAKLAAVSLSAAFADGDDALKLTAADLVDTGVATDVAQVVELARAATLPTELVDQLQLVLDLNPAVETA